MTLRSGARTLSHSADLIGASRRLCARAARTMQTARALRAQASVLRRSAPTPWIGGASGGAIDMRGRIRSKLANGTLPRSESVGAITTRGTGRCCDACDLTIAVGHRAVLATYLDGTVLRFHVVCFDAWETER